MGFSDEPPSRRLFLANVPCHEHGTSYSPGGSFIHILSLLSLPLESLSRPLLEYEARVKIERLLNPQPKTNQ
jgi:hypothetical protein